MEIRYTRTNCRRCAGTGYYMSPSGRNDGKCYTCKGIGKKLTPAGREAQRYFLEATAEAMTRRADEVRPGDVIWHDGRRLKVTEILEPRHDPARVSLLIAGKARYAAGYFRDSGVEVWDAETARRIARDTVARFPRGARLED
ncbi:MAG TPA: hypothetical protein VK039_05765 [Brevibacterium sp.]|nr:hypothetical protein [Brevibacterium sp.]